MIIKNKVIFGIFEMKIDMGYADAGVLDDYTEMMKKIKSTEKISCKIFDGNLKAYDRIKFGMVLLSSANDHGRLGRFNLQVQKLK